MIEAEIHSWLDGFVSESSSKEDGLQSRTTLEECIEELTRAACVITYSNYLNGGRKTFFENLQTGVLERTLLSI